MPMEWPVVQAVTRLISDQSDLGVHCFAQTFCPVLKKFYD